ncbi:hypothetical protein B0H17DRAFT_1146195 [Mycena rosella]|uniref:Uncharacterized protein n=1 Tax=Mycena rosella TaxID=1033263 RepID=A0AAD7CPD3_MYCRO|nr:hypothetical protein B0H17DRAFT_1146195 [Mycena rosella]
MPPLKKVFRDRAAILNGRLASPKKAIKRVAAIALSPVKARAQKKHQNADPEDHDMSTSMQETEPIAAEKENEDVFLAETDPVAQYQSKFHQRSMPETPTAALMAFKLKGKLFTARDCSPELDELYAADAGVFTGDGYPRPAPPKTFLEKMAALGTKQALSAAPDITSAKAALVDIELVLRGLSRVFQSKLNYLWEMGPFCTPSCIAAGRDVYCARRFASLSREYITSRKVLPINPYGMWRKSMLASHHVREHLQELGKCIKADKLVDYLSREDVMDKHGLDKKVSVCTARRYLNELGYR